MAESQPYAMIAEYAYHQTMRPWKRVKQILRKLADGEYERNMTGKPQELMTPADWRSQSAFWRLIDWLRSRNKTIRSGSRALTHAKPISH